MIKLDFTLVLYFIENLNLLYNLNLVLSIITNVFMLGIIVTTIASCLKSLKIMINY